MIIDWEKAGWDNVHLLDRDDSLASFALDISEPHTKFEWDSFKKTVIRGFVARAGEEFMDVSIGEYSVATGARLFGADGLLIGSTLDRREIHTDFLPGSELAVESRNGRLAFFAGPVGRISIEHPS